MWKFQFLGGFSLQQPRSSDVVVSDVHIAKFRTRKAALLIAYLAIHPGPQSRKSLVSLLWPDAEREAGQNSLRVCLASLRTQFGSQPHSAQNLIWFDRYTAELNSNVCTSDVGEFQSELQNAEKKIGSARLNHLETAFRLYKGRLLKGYLEAWIEPLALHIEALFVRVAKELISHYRDLGEIEIAITYASSAARLAPDHGEFMELLWEMGSQSQHEVSSPLVVPSLLTSVVSRTADEVSTTIASSTISDALKAQKRALPRPNLPIYATPFWGRERELSWLLSSIENKTPMSLTTIVGPPGIGKTRIATEAAQKAITQEPEVVIYFVSLASLTSANLFAEAIRIALNLSPNSQIEPAKQIVQMLRHECEHTSSQIILLLDNLEHLLPEAAMLLQVLRLQVPALKVWVTSRAPLRLPGEELLEIGSLPLPNPTGDIDRISETPSVQLFVHKARAIRPNFMMTPSNISVVVRLCHQLEGWPLALEVAASHSQYFTPAQMLAQLENQPDFLIENSADVEGMAGSKHSLQKAILWSYHLLTDASAQLFVSLAIFRGGATLGLIKSVSGDDKALHHLAELVNQSLVTCEERNGELRYGLLEGIRQFARTQCSEPQWETWRRQHAYALQAIVLPPNVHRTGKATFSWMEHVDAELDNIRIALDWAAQNDTELLLQLGTSLGEYWHARGLYNEGKSWLLRILEIPNISATAEQKRAKAKIYSYLAQVRFTMGEFELGLEAARAGSELATETGDTLTLSEIQLQEGKILMYQGNLAPALNVLELSRLGHEQANNSAGEAHALIYLGFAGIFSGTFDKTYEMYQSGVELARQAEDLAILTLGLFFSGDVLGPCGGRYDEAHPYFTEAYRTAFQINDYVLQAYAMWGLCRVALAQGRLVEANAYFREINDRCQRSSLQWEQAFVLETGAMLATAKGDLTRAALLMGAADATRTRLTLPLTSSYAAEFWRHLAPLWEDLDANTRVRYWRWGRKLSVDDALEIGRGGTMPYISVIREENEVQTAQVFLGFPLELSQAYDALSDAHLGSGRLAQYRGDKGSARQHLETSLHYARATHNHQREAQVLELLRVLG